MLVSGAVFFSGCVTPNSNNAIIPPGYIYSPLLTTKFNRIAYPPGTPMPMASGYSIGYKVYNYNQKDADGNLPIKIYSEEVFTGNLTFAYDALVDNGTGLFESGNSSMWHDGGYVFNSLALSFTRFLPTAEPSSN